MDPIKYIFKKPVVSGRISQWKMLLTEYDIQYVTQKAIQGSVLSDYLSHQPMEAHQPKKFDFPDEDIMFIRDCNISGPAEGPEPGSRWTLMFDGASNAKGHGIGEIITSPTSFHISFTSRLCFDCTNNMAEYEACIYDTELAIDLRIKILEVYWNYTLVISQVRGDWETRGKKLVLYREHVVKRTPCFNEITFHYIPREENYLTNALATMATMFKVKWKNEAPAIHIDHLGEPAHCLAMEAESDDKSWFYDINRYLEKQEYPEKASMTDKKALKIFCAKFFLKGDVLYKMNLYFVLL
ncbi:uncharacterized protein LOC127081172 [Lathyrus oleraceus]|uniref:uncharacterized protein LOC127081172 n=1 Tax=Pisum sativum TaxID=3888 RepID=UPI0021D059B0|nr:uncharacterized protein LOC127081172 [Pisum sativum]